MASSSASTLLSAMFTSFRQAVFCRGCLQTVLFHPPSCQGTRIDTCRNGYAEAFMTRTFGTLKLPRLISRGRYSTIVQ